MATTMNLIAKQTVGAGGAASVTFSSIPQTFTDLKVVVSGRASTTTTGIDITFNGSTTGYSNKRLYGTGSGVASDSAATTYISNIMINDSSYTANTFGNGEVYIPNYTSSNNKSVSVDGVSENNATTALMMLTAGLWSNSAAITSVTLNPNAGSFVEFSEFALYGISSSSTQNQTTPSAIGGDVITTDGSYWYHTFLYSGTFTPLKNLTCDYLVVAGGGGGGNAGGGAGGYREFTAQSFTSSIGYSAVIGAGGAAQAKGVNSSFNSNSATGGGQASASTGNGLPGGSGGGAGGTGVIGTGNQGGYSPSEGNNGGNEGGSSTAMGGGGGANAVGGNASGSTGGVGGAGRSSTISGTSVSRGGGGGGAGASTGGNGGVGGGGNGEQGGVGGRAGSPNTGGGGGGGYFISSGAGGSGVVIVKYAV
jgi:hypothetical protein